MSELNFKNSKHFPALCAIEMKKIIHDRRRRLSIIISLFSQKHEPGVMLSENIINTNTNHNATET